MLGLEALCLVVLSQGFACLVYLIKRCSFWWCWVKGLFVWWCWVKMLCGGTFVEIGSMVACLFGQEIVCLVKWLFVWWCLVKLRIRSQVACLIMLGHDVAFQMC